MKSRRWTLRRRVTAALRSVVGVVLGADRGDGRRGARSNRNQVDTLLDRTGPLRTDADELLDGAGRPGDRRPRIRGQRRRTTSSPYTRGY